MGDNTGRKAHAIYDYFALESEQTMYKLHLGAYTGTAVRACTCVCVCIPISTHMYSIIGEV